MLACVNRVLKPQGRFVVEFGGKDNIKHFLSALTESWQTVTGEPTPELITRRWYFPSPDEYTVLLDSHDFAVNYLSWFDRPTPLPHGELGLRAWLAMFMNDAMSLLPEDVQKQVYEQVEARLKPVLWNPDTLQWDADYKRLRIVATKNP
jgi:hypothetical protein